MFNTSYIEINKKNLLNNIKYIKSIIGEDVNLAPVIKGNAYGHGINQIIEILNDCPDVNTVCVYSADEALRVVKKNHDSLNVIIMGWLEDSEIEWAINNSIQYYIFNFERLEKTIETVKHTGQKARIHIEIETGMNRTGFNKTELKKLIEILKNNDDKIIFEGLCTHYAGAESAANYHRIVKQFKLFQNFRDKVINSNIIPRYYHSSSSAATISYPKMRMDLVRVGILTYGYWPSSETYIYHTIKNKLFEDPLKRIISWKTKIMSIKNVKKGQFVGYGNHFFAERDTVIAVIPVGYSHGFSRSLSNTGRVLVHGRRASVIGIVNMNLSIIDITDISVVRIGDEVVLIGDQNDNSISVSSFTQMSDQLNYELLTRLPNDIPRTIK